jgi:ABC-type Mn2+/Zn2+ transport system permease subunit
VSRVAELWTSPLLRRATFEAILVGMLGGLVGVHVLLRRLPFLTVAISHAVFPGVVVATAIGVAPLVGALVFGWLFVGALVLFGAVTRAHGATVIGTLLAASLGIGALLQSAQVSPARNLTALLTGSVLTVSSGEVQATVLLAVVVVVVLVSLHKELVLDAFDRIGARSLGVGRGAEVVFLLALATAVVVALPTVGAILCVVACTVPALAAAQVTRSVESAMVVAAGLGALAGVVGMAISALGGVAAGAAISLTSTGLFLICFGWSRLRVTGFGAHGGGV